MANGTRQQRRAQAKRRRVLRMERAKLAMALLLGELGGKCVACGATSDDAPLTLQHVDGATWRHNTVRYDDRVQRYINEWMAGVKLEVLCLPCNSSDGQRFRGKYKNLEEQTDETPF